jgi:hypothetical protein
MHAIFERKRSPEVAQLLVSSPRSCLAPYGGPYARPHWAPARPRKPVAPARVHYLVLPSNFLRRLKNVNTTTAHAQSSCCAEVIFSLLDYMAVQRSAWALR